MHVKLGSSPKRSSRIVDLARKVDVGTSVGEIVRMPEFDDFGRLLFPVDRMPNLSSTLEDLARGNTFIWYSNLKSVVFARAIDRLKTDADQGCTIFYSIYDQEEIARDPSKRDTGLFFFRGVKNAPTAVVNAGGGFMYVAALQDSLPHAMKISDLGYNAFALVYRPERPYEDLARALVFLYDHAASLGANMNDYSLWGGSAGARMAAVLGNERYLRELTGRSDLPQASAVIMQYTGYSAVSPFDAPTFACVGTNDGIANWRIMQARLSELTRRYGIPTEFRVFEGLRHGFGIGQDTPAQGWIEDAIAFWQVQEGVRNEV